MKLIIKIPKVFLHLVLLLSANQLVAQNAPSAHTPEIWYMGMNDSDKPNLFMKSVGVGDTVLVLHGALGAEHNPWIDRPDEGSRLVVVLNVNKHPFEIINYGSGKEPAFETITDAGEPLEIRWFNDSYIEIPVFNQ